MGNSGTDGTIRMADGRSAKVGDRVYDYYDREWGTVTSAPKGDGWFEFTSTAGVFRTLNGERVVARMPEQAR